MGLPKTYKIRSSHLEEAARYTSLAVTLLAASLCVRNVHAAGPVVAARSTRPHEAEVAEAHPDTEFTSAGPTTGRPESCAQLIVPRLPGAWHPTTIRASDQAAPESGNARPGRSSSHAIALIRQPSAVRTNCVEIAPRPSKGTPFKTPRLA